MCGIVGIAGENVSTRWLHLMSNSIKHRGPDDEGYLIVNTKNNIFEERGGEDSKIPLKNIIEPTNFNINLALGHRRLSIIDPSPSGHQPMKYEKDGKIVWIVYNGEIYNYIEIKDELINRGYEFRTSTDTEIILASYLEWGFDCVKKFNGMWAFVIYDPQKNILFGSRDRFGVKPLYYHQTSTYFSFASEIKALLTLPHIKKVVNEDVLWNYLLYGACEYNNETFFKEIYKLLPSHYFKFDIDTRKLTIRKYYELKHNSKFGRFSQPEFERIKRKTRSLIQKAVKIRLRSDVAVGSCLSGGIDSSSIVLTVNSILREMKVPQVGDRQKVFTACYNDPRIDESYFASKVVEKTGAEWYRSYPNSSELLSDLYKLIYCQEEPFGSLSIYAQFKVMELAKRKGVKVLLDGQGGDELFTGYTTFYSPFFLDMIKGLKVVTLFRELRKLKNSPIRSLKDLILQITKHLAAAYLPQRLKIYIIKRNDKIISRYIKQEFLNKIPKKDVTKEIVAFSINDFCYLLFSGYQLQKLLKYEDRNSMIHSIEARTPFSDDIDLIEFVFSIPGVYKIHNGVSKYLLRQAMKDLLPKEILNRKDKIGFAVPEKDWLFEIKEDLKKELNVENKYIDTKTLVKDLEELLSSEKIDSGSLWRVINVVLWMKIFDVQPP